MKVSAALSHIILWLKAILYNWNALSEMISSEMKLTQADVEAIKYLKNYLELPLESLKESLNISIDP